MTIASDLDSEGCMKSIDLILEPGTMQLKEQQAIASCMATGGCCQATRDRCMHVLKLCGKRSIHAAAHKNTTAYVAASDL